MEGGGWGNGGEGEIERGRGGPEGPGEGDSDCNCMVKSAGLQNRGGKYIRREIIYLLSQAPV